MSRRHLINSSDVFVIKGFTVENLKNQLYFYVTKTKLSLNPKINKYQIIVFLSINKKMYVLTQTDSKGLFEYPGYSRVPSKMSAKLVRPFWQLQQYVYLFRVISKDYWDLKTLIPVCWYLILYIFYFFFKLIFRLQRVFTAGAGFFNIPGKYENVVLIIKNPRNRNKVLSDHKK